MFDSADEENDSEPPILTAAVDAEEGPYLPEAPWATVDSSPATERRYTGEIIAGICVAVFIGAGSYMYFGAPGQLPSQAAQSQMNEPGTSAGVAAGSNSVVAPAATTAKTTSNDATGDDTKSATRVGATPPPPEPRPAAAQAVTRADPAPVAPVAVLPANAGQPVESVTAAMAIPDSTRKAATPVVIPAKPTRVAATAKAVDSRQHRTRATRAAMEAQSPMPALARPERAESASPAAAPTGPCTATVAALGLCSASSTQSKE